LNGKYLEKLNSHNSSDRSSGATGDIVVRNRVDDSLYEVVEVKFDIKPTAIMMEDVFKKIRTTRIAKILYIKYSTCFR